MFCNTSSRVFENFVRIPQITPGEFVENAKTANRPEFYFRQTPALFPADNWMSASRAGHRRKPMYASTGCAVILYPSIRGRTLLSQQNLLFLDRPCHGLKPIAVPHSPRLRPIFCDASTCIFPQSMILCNIIDEFQMQVPTPARSVTPCAKKQQCWLPRLPRRLEIWQPHPGH